MKRPDKLDETVKQYAPALANRRSSERAQSLAQATAAITQAHDAAAAALKRDLDELQERRDAKLSELEAAAEATRLECAATILAQAFDSKGPKGLTSLIVAFLQEPGRQSTLALRSTWAELNGRAELELGARLDDEVFGAVLLDVLLAEPGMAGGLNYCTGTRFGGPDALSSALSLFCRRAKEPAALQSALERLEGELRSKIARGAGQLPLPDQVARHALRRAHATTRDLHEARIALNLQIEKRELVAAAANASPMDNGGINGDQANYPPWTRANPVQW
jgi:hypothetical protein